MKRIVLMMIILAIIIPSSSVSAAYGVQTKTSGCAANQTLSDPTCTPGAILTTSTAIICRYGYTKTVRNVSLKTKKKVFAEYNIPYSLHSNYEVDHLISLEIGGSNDISNLFPESYNIKDGARIKDKFENYLHAQVCKGKMTIEEAQAEISSDWLDYYLASKGLKIMTSALDTQNALTASTVVSVHDTTQSATVSSPNTSKPAGATAKCNDGTYSYSLTRSGTCSRHGGVGIWY